jgi:hypothetical protein
MKLKIPSSTFRSFPSARAVLLSAPRVLVPLGALLALSGLNSCVSRLNYEEATSAAEVEREGHRRAELDLSAAKARIAELEGELRARLDAREQRMAEEKFQNNVASKERDETVSLVTQLRGELARANEHIEAYARSNARLEHELGAAREGGPSPLLSEVRGLLTSAHLEQSVRVSENASGVVLSVPSELIFKKGEAELSPSLSALSSTLARFGETHPELSVVVREGAADPALPETIGKQRRDGLRALLAHPKWSGRLKFETASSGGAPLTYELGLGFASAR